MLAKTIAFQDLDGNPITETFYFNLSKPEIAKLEFSRDDGQLSDYLKHISQSTNAAEILGTFEMFIRVSIGQRSDDGRRFIKSDEIAESFIQSDAYSELFMELVSNPEQMAEFFKSIFPADMAEKMETLELPTKREYSDDEFLRMSDDEFYGIVGTDEKNWSRRELQLAFKRKSGRAA